MESKITEVLNLGVDYKNRRIYFGENSEDNDGGFDWASVEHTIRAIHKMSGDAPKKPIELHMNSCGGDSLSAIRLYDVIQSCPTKIIFVGGGLIASSATWIMCGCDERLLHKHTKVMLHDGFDSIEGKHTDALIDAKFSEQWQQRLYELYAENSRMPYTFWANICQRDVYLSAEETVALGLADKVIEPKKRGNLRRSRTAILHQDTDPKVITTLVKDIYKRIRLKRNFNKLEISIKPEEIDNNLVVDNGKDDGKAVSLNHNQHNEDT